MAPSQCPEVSHVDLVIIGAGPAGLMAAAWASSYGISTRILDKNASQVKTGQADGLQSRTLEIFDSFGFADRPLKEGFHVLEICSWNPDKNRRLQRTQRAVAQRPGVSRFQQVALNQGCIEEIITKFLQQNGNLKVERNMEPTSLHLEHAIIDDPDAWPITLGVRHGKLDKAGADSIRGLVAGDHAQENLKDQSQASHCPSPADDGNETIKAKYLIGCDGAHSWTRNEMGLSLIGESTDQVWGVMDIVPLTNFPDIRLSCAIHSASCGTIMTVPRERRLVRFYIQLMEVGEGRTFDRSSVTLKSIFETARKIIAPYVLDYHYCDWWSVYQIGQRVAPKFDVGRRIFLAGDAVHNHSPKAGQGMNVSMQDTYNLCWKISSIVKGYAKADILVTYHSERHKVAEQLIAVDHEISRFYSVNSAGRSDYQAFRNRFTDFLSGVAVTYEESILVYRSDHEVGDTKRSSPVADKVQLGARLPSYQVFNQSNAKPIQMADLLRSDGRWRILLFAGDLRDQVQRSRIHELGDTFRGLLERYTRPEAKIDTIIELLTIHSAPRVDVELLELHEIYHPWNEFAGWDYEKVYADDLSHHEGFENAYEKYGIDRTNGGLIVCRPDQHVGCMTYLDEARRILEEYFDRILIRQ